MTERTDKINSRKLCKWYNICPMKRFNEAAKLDDRWINNYCKNDWKNCVRYQMEERGEFHPDYMLPDGSLELSLREA